MAPTLRLHYFNLPGRAEVSRILLSIGNIPYEEVSYTREQWPEVKPKMPLGQVPVLEVDGKMLAQSSAIDRYCAKLAGLFPTDPWAAALADQATATLQDAFDLIYPTFALPTVEEKVAARQKLLEGPFGNQLKNLNKLVEQAGEGFITGPKLSLADVAIYHGLSNLKSGFFDGIPADYLDKYPALKAFRSRVASVPEVQKYLAKYTDGSRAAYQP